MITILLLLLYASLAFGSVEGCSMDKSTACSPSRHAEATGSCSGTATAIHSCYANQASCSADEKANNVFLFIQALGDPVQVVQFLTSIQLDFRSPALNPDKPRYISNTPSKTPGERLAFLHLLRI